MRNNKELKMDNNEFNVNDILFTGKDEIYINNENLDKMKNELDDEINTFNNNENDIINYGKFKKGRRYYSSNGND